MKNITINVNKLLVYNEIAKTTSYIGARGSEDGDIYEKVFTTDEDQIMLERFWLEACNHIVNSLRSVTVLSSFQKTSQNLQIGSNFEITLSLSDRFNDELTSPISSDMFSFFVNYILYKWLCVTKPEEQSTQISAFEKNEESLKNLIFQKERPRR